jgi:hypothetical protein
MKSFDNLFFYFLVFIIPFMGYGATVRIINDSPFPLSATILSATGEVFGRYSIQPQQQVSWQNSNLNVNKSSQSPFTVIFYCSTGEVWGTVSGVATGAMVQASTASGPRFCKPKDDKKGKEEQEKSDLQYQPHPINPHQWDEQQRF